MKRLSSSKVVHLIRSTHNASLASFFKLIDHPLKGYSEAFDQYLSI